MPTAFVVGSGPNGLAGAVVLARAGVDVTVVEAADAIGGGARSSEYLLPGMVHDHCSAFHPLAVASPFLAGLDLDRLGLRWLAPAIDCAHPLDDGSAGVMYRSIEQTAAEMGSGGRRWAKVFGPVVEHIDAVLGDVTGPVLRVPRSPRHTGRFGMVAAAPATTVSRALSGEPARALWAGIAAHAFHRLDRPMTSAVGAMLVAAGHAHGWVVAEGGSQAIVNALAAELKAHGGRIETGRLVTNINELDQHDLLLLDVAPSAAASILGDQLPPKVAKAYRRFRHGPGAFKVDFAVEGGVPWRAEAARTAGTVHLGGDADEVFASEREIHHGRMPERPFVLVGQQYLADPSRSVGSTHPIWSYAHVPHGYTGDATDAIIAQIARFAPGFRERIVGTAVRSTTDFSTSNPNFVGGDIIGGASTPAQLVFRPRVAVDPYATGVPGVYLCSASTPPGAGAHGICGVNAARRSLASL